MTFNVVSTVMVRQAGNVSVNDQLVRGLRKKRYYNDSETNNCFKEVLYYAAE